MESRISPRSLAASAFALEETFFPMTDSEIQPTFSQKKANLVFCYDHSTNSTSPRYTW